MSHARITVGIPTFNRARWLRGAIESVLAQTFTSFRLIVSDNASEDETPDVVRSFSDDRIEYLRSERNRGAIGNLNHLVAIAETDYLVLLPDDDILYPEHLGAAVELLDRFETVGLAHSAFDFIDDESRVTRHVNPLPSRPPVRIQSRDLALEWMMSSRWGLCFPSVVYRTRAIAPTGGFREEEEPFGDRKLWMRIALKWDFGYIAKPLAGFRTHANARQANVGRQSGVMSDLDRLRLYSQIHFQRRMAFIDETLLEPGRASRLRALATLQLLVEDASYGLPWSEVGTRVLKLAQAHPRVVLRVAFWRFAAAQLGGRRLRSALRGALERRPARPPD